MLNETYAEFKDAVNKEVGRRARLFKHYTEITPSNHSRKQLLSFYRGRRDQKRTLWQDVQEADVRSLGYSCISEWAERFSGDSRNANPATTDENSFRANPDLLPEPEAEAPQFSDEDIEKANKLITLSKRILTPTEIKVFLLTQQGIGSTEIARRLGMKQGSVTTLMSRIVTKMRKAYEVI